MPAERIAEWIVELDGVGKTYPTRKGPVVALEGVSLTIEAGEWVSIEGPSGAGKTTVLMAIGGMLRPSTGIVRVMGQGIYDISREARARFRRQKIGFVFQLFHLIPYLTVWENVWLGGQCSPETRLRVETLLERLGLTDRLGHKPHQLSAGEKQRTAIARAMLNQPALILADEPTGNLDMESAAEVLRILDEYRREGGTILLVTHGDQARGLVDRTLRLNHGRLETRLPAGNGRRTAGAGEIDSSTA